MKRRLAFFLSLCLFLLCAFPLGACQGPIAFDPNKATEPTVPVDLSFGKTDEQMFTSRDKDHSYDEASAVRIELQGTKIACSSKSVQINGSSATITSGGTYILSGTLTNGEIIVWAGATDKPHIVLDGVDITSPNASILVLGADKTVITLAEGSENVLIHGGAFYPVGDANVDGVIFSTADLTVGGAGSLLVYTGLGHGIVSNDDLVITGGRYDIDVTGHALKGNDSVRVCGAPDFTVKAGKDGLHAENQDDPTRGFVYIADGSYAIEAAGDGISASAHMQIKGGDFHLSTGVNTKYPTDSKKGLKAEGGMLIEGGSLTIDTEDDALHCGGTLAIKGGALILKTGDDALHADMTLALFGGSVDVENCYKGLKALHVEMLGGRVDLRCTDDGIRAADVMVASDAGGGIEGSVHIGGGVLTIEAAGDGIDTSGSFLMDGGQVTVCCPTEGAVSILDFGGSAEIHNGIFTGFGASMMAQGFSASSTQGVIALSTGAPVAGTTVSLSGGRASLTCKSEFPFAMLILSAPGMVKGESYTVAIGESAAAYQAY